MLSPFKVICAFRESSSVIDALDLSFDDYSNDPTANYYWRRHLTRCYNSLHSVLTFDYTQGGTRTWYKYNVIA